MKKNIMIFAAIFFVFLLMVYFANDFLPDVSGGKLDDRMATESGIDTVVQGNNRFAFELYDVLSEGDGNVFFSPWSITSAISMTYEGARGKTANEMASVLHLPENDTVRRSSFARLRNLLNSDREYTLKEANALWTHENYGFLQNYIDVNKNYYGANVENVDFVGETEETRQKINEWVEEETEGKIKELIKPNKIDTLTKLVLTNAIYFKGDWLNQFDKEDTSERDFRVSPGETKKVQMMRLGGEEFETYEDDELKVVKLPYKGGDLSMFILLPKEVFGIDGIEITPEKIKQIDYSMEKKKIDIYIPKFEFEEDYSLKDILIEMGMPTPFSMGADFSGMDGSDMLYISFVEHKAYVKVNEEGTEAAAATGVGMATKAALTNVFYADHPFFFMIRDDRNGNILFMGKFQDPE